MNLEEPYNLLKTNYSELERELKQAHVTRQNAHYITNFCFVKNVQSNIPMTQVLLFKKGLLAFNENGINIQVNKDSVYEREEFTPGPNKLRTKVSLRRFNQEDIFWSQIDDESAKVIWMPRQYTFRKVMDSYLIGSIRKLGEQFANYSPELVADALDRAYGALD